MAVGVVGVDCAASRRRCERGEHVAEQWRGCGREQRGDVVERGGLRGNLGGISFRVVGVFLLVPKGLLLETPSFSSGLVGKVDFTVRHLFSSVQIFPNSFSGFSSGQPSISPLTRKCVASTAPANSVLKSLVLLVATMFFS
ncbi:unnamed protein product [Miscanthus lutarioriparius]|uniref:Uncharacterized protein n=1 Tax=Miscanthus lutarioriparius TaxID=422564 RepID=A0A811P0H0_9POAL|nr:unnamed protein product [Miscanthus lutarioriparius]